MSKLSRESRYGLILSHGIQSITAKLTLFARVLCLLLPLLINIRPVFAQSTINWSAPLATTNINDIDFLSGNTLYALNGGSASLNVGGINFESANFVNLPSSVTFTSTGSSTGNSPGSATLGDVYNGSMTSTGNAGYDQLIQSLAWSSGSPGGISTGNYQFDGLTPGTDYQFQVWFNDQRDNQDHRVMQFGDTLGSNVNLAGGNPASGVQSTAYGQHAIGTFTANSTSQNLSLESIEFGNLHYNAILLRDTQPFDPGPTSDPPAHKATPGWIIDSQEQWFAAAASNATQFGLSEGLATPAQPGAQFESHIQQFTQKQSFDTLTFQQTAQWGSGKWNSSGNLGPTTEPDAPVFVSPGDGEYYYLNRSTSGSHYHVWSSSDMENWTNHGNVTGQDWITSAEYADGTFYVYFDEPNDENPHVMTFTDITDPSTRVYHGEVLDNQSHGSDMAAFRDLDGTFHIVYEDWAAINARQHSWDSQYAGHTSSPDGINGFSAHEHTPPIDLRGNPTGQFLQYNHPNGTYSYEVHDGTLDAWGDYELIRVGETYYLFADDHPEGGSIGLGYWYSDDLYGEFTYGGMIRQGLHPDPTTGFAEGEFVMFVQGNATGAGQDLTSTGPWVDGVEAQAGVDIDGDGEIDVWTNWQEISESYARIDGFAKVYALDPAALDLSGLPDGYGIQFRFNSNDIEAVFDSIVLDSSTLLPGDFNLDGNVDGTDFLAWQRGLGSTYDASDLQDWQSHYNMAASLQDSFIAVPEPTSLIILWVAFSTLAISQRRRSHPNFCIGDKF